MGRSNKVVVKIGTKVITSKDRMIDAAQIENIVSQFSAIMDKGIEAILVTSGAIGAGMALLGMKKRPSRLSELQAAAAIGQNHLMHLYSEGFRKRGYKTGQILLTQEDFNDRKRYINIKHTINALLKHKAVPIINENDTVATEEIRCGDNDRLSSLVADLCEADRLVILSDVDGLMDERGKVIPFVNQITADISKLGGKSQCDLGTGGMRTKIDAAKLVTGAGIECIIANGREKNILYRVIVEDANTGTTFKSGKGKFIARKRWIAFSSRPKGYINVDDGAKIALLKRDKSLLASGITGVKGDFKAGDTIGITDSSGEEFARGLSSYSSDDIGKIKGMKSGNFKNILGYNPRDEVIHKDNLAIL